MRVRSFFKGTLYLDFKFVEVKKLDFLVNGGKENQQIMNFTELLKCIENSY